MTLLLLAGTGDGRRLAWGLVDIGLPVVVSLAGVTRMPEPLPLPSRVGGFGGEAGFVDYLEQAGITAVLDATHPFAARITERTARVCAARGLPYLQIMRPEWEPVTEDDWTMIDAEEDAARHVRIGSTVFLAAGRQSLHRFAGLLGCRVIARQIDPPTEPFPFEGGEFLIGRPPFSVERDEGLFAQLGVDWIVVKNAGGEESRSKLIAARNLGIPVLMIRRPPMPDVPRVASVAQALEWVRAL